MPLTSAQIAILASASWLTFDELVARIGGRRVRALPPEEISTADLQMARTVTCPICKRRSMGVLILRSAGRDPLYPDPLRLAICPTCQAVTDLY